MEKNNYSQLELFSNAQRSASLGGEARTSFLRRIWAYEKTILMVIGFTVTSVIAFSLGVEKGKNLVSVKARFDTAAVKKQAVPAAIAMKTTVTKKPLPAATIKQELFVPEVKPKVPQQGYTIQLATFKNREFANKEADDLRKKGLSPLVVSKGAYMVLCVGNFSDKETAKSLLSELGKKYQGCFIRRI